jgi:hypothetical protein
MLRSALLPAAATALATVPAIARSTSAEGSGLSEMIERHRGALDKWRAAADAEEQAYSRAFDLDQRKPICVPSVSLPNGRDAGSGSYQLGIFSAEKIRARIDEAHEAIERVHCSRFSKAMFPELAATVQISMAASKQRSYAQLEAAEVKMESRWLPHRDAMTIREAADDEEHLARLAFVLYRPKDNAEAAQKAAYIDSFESFYDFCDDERFIRGLVAALGAVKGGEA